MPHEVIVIGGSAGSVDPLIALLSRLPAGLPSAVFVVIHIAASSKGELAGVIQRIGEMECAVAEDGEPVRPGRIYLARPDYHLLLEPGIVRVTHGPKENRVRPAIDPLFRSAASAYGSSVIGVVLSGMLDDGSQGLAAIKRAGGLAIVQDPLDARFPSMPSNAGLAADPDYRVAVSGMSDLLIRLASSEAGVARLPDDRMAEEAGVPANRLMSEASMRGLGRPSVFTCPDCGGILFEIGDSEVLRFRCSIGHAYGAYSLIAGKDSQVEEALSASLRALQESERLSRRLADTLDSGLFPKTYDELHRKADRLHRHAEAVQTVLAGIASDEVHEITRSPT